MEKAAKRRFFTSKRVTADELRNWSVARERIGHQLKEYYQAFTTEELPPRLLAVVKRLDEEQPDLLGEHVQTPGKTKD